jgi:hypothetical protein
VWENGLGEIIHNIRYSPGICKKIHQRSGAWLKVALVGKNSHKFNLKPGSTPLEQFFLESFLFYGTLQESAKKTTSGVEPGLKLP